MPGEWRSIVPQLVGQAATLSDVAVLVRTGARWHIAVLAENSMSRHEHVSRTIDQLVTGAGHILAMNGVVAVRRPVAIQIAVVDRGSSVTTMMVVNACGRNAHRAKPGEEPSDPEACHGRQAFVERHGGPPFFAVVTPQRMAGRWFRRWKLNFTSLEIFRNKIELFRA